MLKAGLQKVLTNLSAPAERLYAVSVVPLLGILGHCTDTVNGQSKKQKEEEKGTNELSEFGSVYVHFIAVTEMEAVSCHAMQCSTIHIDLFRSRDALCPKFRAVHINFERRSIFDSRSVYPRRGDARFHVPHVAYS